VTRWVILCAGTVATLLWAGDTKPMEPKLIHHDAFTVVGLAGRTTNAKEQTPQGVIGRCWAELTGKNVLARIPGRADDKIVAVYTDYASDKDGEYTYVLGARVNSVKDIPDGMVATTVPAGRYALYTSRSGPVPAVVIETWQRIWATQPADAAGRRAYRSDFEIYDERARNPQHSVVDVYVGLRN